MIHPLMSSLPPLHLSFLLFFLSFRTYKTALSILSLSLVSQQFCPLPLGARLLAGFTQHYTTTSIIVLLPSRASERERERERERGGGGGGGQIIMCDYFLQRMEGEQAAGDLADIVLRAGGAAAAAVAGGGIPSTEWQLPPAEEEEEEPGFFPLPPSSSDGSGMSGADAFGDPFAGLPDPFGGDYPSSSGGAAAAADFFDAVVAKAGFVDVGVLGGGGGGGCDGGGVDGGGGGSSLLGMSKPILPRAAMQLPSVSPRAIRPYPVMAGDTVKLGAPMAGGPCAFDGAAAAGLHMSSSPRGAVGGIKRRKNQARKVVCIPAPAAAGGRTSGEVVPSDLWAWRKYGQKPIKGSPYPRGYYRCSSSKGCSARKQVERSRTDPNMLVITYTSEHNHPWPTQRNALAGSTRSHHAKNSSSNSSSSGASSASKNNSSHSGYHHQKPLVKAEPNDQSAAAAAATTAATVPVKEEAAMVGTSSEALAKTTQKSMEDAAAAASATAAAVEHSDLMQQMFSQSYRPMIPEAAAGGHHDDFFADLAELESDPMSLIFSKEYMATNYKPAGDPAGKEMNAVDKGLDPAYMLDWSSTTVVTRAGGSSFMQGEGGL
uniref:WRKY domain-containing protein n=1 Tax=Oryza glumipatula TaxID=40148 RepID=A0A0D9YWV9_9ORYZ